MPQTASKRRPVYRDRFRQRQSLDILAQVLESLDVRLRKSNEVIRRSFGDHARNLKALNAPQEWQELLTEIRKHRKTISILEPEEEKVTYLTNLIRKLTG